MDLQSNAGVSDMVNAESIVAMLNAEPLQYSISLLDFWLAHSSSCFANFKPNELESNTYHYSDPQQCYVGPTTLCGIFTTSKLNVENIPHDTISPT